LRIKPRHGPSSFQSRVKWLPASGFNPRATLLPVPIKPTTEGTAEPHRAPAWQARTGRAGDELLLCSVSAKLTFLLSGCVCGCCGQREDFQAGHLCKSVPGSLKSPLPLVPASGTMAGMLQALRGHQALPIRIPEAKTNTPPRTTWMLAER
jgi:hypothetical protein